MFEFRVVGRGVVFVGAAAMIVACRGGGHVVTRMALASATTGITTRAFALGGAPAANVESLKYFVKGISICETLDTSGTGFQNPGNCLEVYSGDQSAFQYGLQDNLAPLADEARKRTTGYVDLIDAASRAAFASAKALTSRDAHSYAWGIITWAPPLKVRASIPLSDGTVLYTHDGRTVSDVFGVDSHRGYFTEPSTSLLIAPAEDAVALLPNGGNQFRFQAPLVVTQADVDNDATWVLDLVFNPDGIIKGYSGDQPGGPSMAIRESDSDGGVTRGISVPMLDLVPVPHRATESVMRESYVGPLTVDGSIFDVRIELYSIDGDASRTIYGVDVKSLITSQTTAAPPDISHIEYLSVSDAGPAISFESWSHTPVITEFVRGSNVGDTATATLKCATNGGPEGSSGGSAFIASTCPSERVPVTLKLVRKAVLTDTIPNVFIGGSDAGAHAAADRDAGKR